VSSSCNDIASQALEAIDVLTTVLLSRAVTCSAVAKDSQAATAFSPASYSVSYIPNEMEYKFSTCKCTKK